MKKYIFPFFITCLGLFTAYIFYSLWHTKEVNIPKIPELPKEKVIEDLSVPKTSLEADAQMSEEKEMLSMSEKQETIPNLTPEQMETKTQAVYDALTPEDYEETMSEASEAFEALDTDVETLDTRLSEEMEDIEEMNIDIEIEDNAEEQTYEDMNILENEEEVDMEQEDVNNP